LSINKPYKSHARADDQLVNVRSMGVAAGFIYDKAFMILGIGPKYMTNMVISPRVPSNVRRNCPDAAWQNAIQSVPATEGEREIVTQ
jgi:hypothetical protein